MRRNVINALHAAVLSLLVIEVGVAKESCDGSEARRFVYRIDTVANDANLADPPKGPGGGSAVLLDVWWEKELALFLTAGHVASEYAGLPVGGDVLRLASTDGLNVERVVLKGSVPCANITADPATEDKVLHAPCRMSEDSDIAVITAKFDKNKATVASQLMCVPRLVLNPYDAKGLIGFGYTRIPETAAERRFWMTNEGSFNPAGPGRSRYTFGGMPLREMSGGPVFVPHKASGVILAGILRELNAVQIGNPVAGQAQQVTVPVAGASMFSTGFGERDVLTPKIMLELCQLNAFPNLKEGTELAEVSKWNCVSPRVAYFLKQLGSRPDDMTADLEMRQLDYKTALSDFDFLQLSYLASRYPGIRAALRRPTRLFSFLMKVAQESNVGPSVTSDAYFQSIAAPRFRFHVTIYDEASFENLRALVLQVGIDQMLAFVEARFAALQAEAGSGHEPTTFAKRSARAALATAEALDEIARVGNLASPAQRQAIYLSQFKLASALSRQAPADGVALLRQAEQSLRLSAGIPKGSELDNALALAQVLTYLGNHYDAIKVLSRGQQLATKTVDIKLDELLVRAVKEKQIESAKAVWINNWLEGPPGTRARALDVLADPDEPVKITLSSLNLYSSAPGFSEFVMPPITTTASAPSVTEWRNIIDLGDVSAAKYLVNADLVSISSPIDKLRNTPIHAAARQCDPAMVELMLSSGASLHIKNKQGETPLSLAQKLCKPDDPTLKVLKWGKYAADVVPR